MKEEGEESQELQLTAQRSFADKFNKAKIMVFRIKVNAASQRIQKAYKIGVARRKLLKNLKSFC